MAAPKMTKNQMRRAKKKEQKKTQAETKPSEASPTNGDEQDAEKQDEPNPSTEPTIKAEPTDIAAEDDATLDDPAFAMYKDIFAKFGAFLDDDEVAREANAGTQGTVFFDGDDDIPDDDDDDENAPPKLSKKKQKKLNKLSVAELKALVNIPEVVEWQDPSSSDPRLLVQIKAHRNVVPVPTHWQLKREYLSSKRGIEKSAFRLPQFIAETGITEMRDAVLEKQAEQSLKQKQRERVQPKMGKLDIDYNKLYEAFFRFQTKPDLTRFGDVYYEGKEAEVDYRHFRPGDLTDATKEALGIPPGAPPPWLINQQRFGPPPSYPNLKIPGLNAPPPPGGQWGFQPGQWGKPPVDEYNRPLYGGDVFGLTGSNAQGQQGQQLQPSEPIDRTPWGELQKREDESEEEESEEGEDSDEEDDEMPPGGTETPSGMQTPSGYTSTVVGDYGSGVETSIAGEMDLRKERNRGYDTEESSAPRSAYQILPERAVRAEGFFGSGHGYDLSSTHQAQAQAQPPSSRPAGVPMLGEDDTRKRKKPGDVDVALDLDSVGGGKLDKEELRRKFEESKSQEGPGARWAYDDDLSEMIAEESRKRQRTEQERQDKRSQGRHR